MRKSPFNITSKILFFSLISMHHLRHDHRSSKSKRKQVLSLHDPSPTQTYLSSVNSTPHYMIGTRNHRNPLSLQMHNLPNSRRDYVLPAASEYLSLEIGYTVFRSLIQVSNISRTFAQESVVAPTFGTIFHLAHM